MRLAKAYHFRYLSAASSGASALKMVRVGPFGAPEGPRLRPDGHTTGRKPLQYSTGVRTRQRPFPIVGKGL